MVTICSNCGLNLSNLETNEKFILCNHCKIFIPKGANSYQGKICKNNERRCKNMIKTKIKKEKTAIKVQRTLTCSKCGAVKKAGKKRVEKWKGKVYFCRECRRKMKEEKKSKVKSKKK